MGSRTFKTSAPSAAGTTKPKVLEVLVLADDAVSAEAIAAVLSRSRSVRATTQVGVAALYRRIAKQRPAVVIWFAGDVDVATFDRVDAIRRDVRVPLYVLARWIDPAALRRAFHVRPEGLAVMLRDERVNAADLFRATAQLLAGRTVLSPELVEQLLDDGDTDDLLRRLTPLERQTLELLALGLRNGAIARRLDRSEKTIEKLVGCLFKKLGLEAGTHPDLDRRVSVARIFLTQAGLAGRAAPVAEPSLAIAL